MSKIIGVFNSESDAEKAIRSMRNKGFKDNEISIVSKKGTKEADNNGDMSTTATGITTGGVIGGIAGLMASAGALAIPGVGPIVAAGPIAALLTGAVGGGIVGGLVDMGIPENESRKYQEDVKQGGILVVADADQKMVNEAADIMRQYGAYDVNTR